MTKRIKTIAPLVSCSIVRWLGIVLLGWPALGLAQEEVEEKREAGFRFLAIGNAPPFRQEIRDGVRYELPPPPGSIPPRRVVLSIPGKDDGEIEVGEVRLQLGRLSEPIRFQTGEGLLVLRAEEDGEPWLKIPRPEATGDYLVVLRRDPGLKLWDKAVPELIPDRAPAGSVTLFNLSGVPLAVVLGNDKFVLTSGKRQRKPLAAGKPVEFQVGHPVRDGGLKRLASQSLEQGPQERTLVILTRADREDARRPVKITVLREDARKRLPVPANPK